MIIPSRHRGTTRLRRDVCDYDTNDEQYIRAQIAEYKPSDSFDAFCIFEYFVVWAVRHYGIDSPETRHFSKMSDLHRGFLTDAFLEKEKAVLSLPTSAALAEYGKSLVPTFLKE